MLKRVFNNFAVALFAGLMIVVCSCSRELVEVQPEQETNGWHSAGLTFDVRCVGFDWSVSDTRASGGHTWNDGDIVYLLLADKDCGKVQAYVRYDGSTNEWSEVMYEGYKSSLICNTERVAEAYFIEGVGDLSGTELQFASTRAVYACATGTYVYPADGDMTVRVLLKPLTGRVRFHGTVGQTASISGVRTYTSFSRTTGKFSESASPTVNTTVTGTGYTPFIYCSFVDESEPMLTVTTDKVYRTVFDASSSVLKTGRSGYMDLPVAESHRGWITFVAVTDITLDRTTLSLSNGETATLTATVLPEDATDRGVTWSSSDQSVATVSSDGKVTAVSAGTATVTATSVSNADMKAMCIVKVADGFANGHEYVDLGLPSGTLWATCNVGASSPSDYGNYYAWGETTTKSSYTESNYSYSSYPTTLPVDRDAARANWGGSWSMPTLTDFQELYNECTWTWTTINGKNGYKVSSRKNSSFIFLPAAGWFSSSLYSEGLHSCYWSSSLYTSNTSYACQLSFDSSGVYPSSSTGRYYGQSVRPVLRKSVAVTGITLDKTSLSLNKGETATLIATVLPENATDKSVTWSSSNKSVATVSDDGVVKAVSAGTTTVTVTSVSDTSVKATCTVTVTANSGGQENGHEYVDLGLSSGTLWATCNVGATSPEEYGNYYAWGETTTKSNYTDSNYSYLSNPTTLPADRDAARANWGGSWSMPTTSEFKELDNECTWTWTTMNGKNGYKVSSRKNSSYIFLPVAGNFGPSLTNAGSYGFYWSSSLDTSSTSYAYGLSFGSSFVSPSGSSNRFFGRSVRPVLRK